MRYTWCRRNWAGRSSRYQARRSFVAAEIRALIHLPVAELKWPSPDRSAVRRIDHTSHRRSRSWPRMKDRRCSGFASPFCAAGYHINKKAKIEMDAAAPFIFAFLTIELVE